MYLSETVQWIQIQIFTEFPFYNHKIYEDFFSQYNISCTLGKSSGKSRLSLHWELSWKKVNEKGNVALNAVPTKPTVYCGGLHLPFK